MTNKSNDITEKLVKYVDINRILGENLRELNFGTTLEFSNGDLFRGSVTLARGGVALLSYSMQHYTNKYTDFNKYGHTLMIDSLNGETTYLDKAFELIEKTATELECDNVACSVINDKDVFDKCVERGYIAKKGSFLNKKLK